MLGDIGRARIRDLEIFDLVARTKSIREAARRAPSTPGQVSKTIRSLEKLLGTKLFKRSAAGALLTNEGNDLQEIVKDLLVKAERMEVRLVGRGKTKTQRTLAVAGTSFLNTHFSTPLICQSFQGDLETQFRFLDLPPDQIVPVGLRSGFDLAVHFGKLAWPSTWVSGKLGTAHWVLAVRQKHPLAKKSSLKQILEFPFVVPSYWTPEGLTRGNDHFPVPLNKRKIGYETATADAAIPILLTTDQIAYLPDILVRPLVDKGELREVRSGDLPPVERELYLSAKSDSVPATIYNRLLSEMSEKLGG